MYHPDDKETFEGDAQDIHLAIKINESSSEYVCAVCGDERISASGLELFLADTWDLVCAECGREHAPLLVALLDLGGAAEGFTATRLAVSGSETSESKDESSSHGW